MAKAIYTVIKEGDVYASGKKFEIRKTMSAEDISKFLEEFKDKGKYPGLTEAHISESAAEIKNVGA